MPQRCRAERLYRRMDDLGGPVQGRWRRRRDAEYRAWELEDGTILRYHQRQRGEIILESHLRRPGVAGGDGGDPAGGGRGAGGWCTRLPPREIILSGWEVRPIPGGSVRAPVPALEGDGGAVEFLVLGGGLQVWHEAAWADVYSQEFADGVLAGCGCVLVDRVSTWVDGHPGVRLRLDVVGTAGAYPSLVDLWAVPLAPPDPAEGAPAGPTGVWFASYVVRRPTEGILSMAPGLALAALVRLDDLASLAPDPDPEPVP